MNEEQQNPAPSAQEDDLFSGSPAAVKPLFEEPQAPVQPKPLFASGEPADQAFIEQRLKEAGPTAFVPPPVPEPQPEALAQPAEVEQPAYIPSGNPAPAEPVIVNAVPDAGKEQHAEIPTAAPEMSLTATAEPQNNRYAERVPAESTPAQAPASAAAKQPRYGKIRVREAVVPDSVERNKRVLTVDTEAASIGEIMQDARQQAGLTLEQAAALTHIKKDYILALEADDQENLPGGIFPSAYVRTLCGLYNLNDSGREAALKKVRETFSAHDNVPEQLIQHLEQDVQRNEAEEQRVNKIFYLIVSGAAALAVLLIAGIVLLTVSLRGDSAPKLAETEKTPVRQEQRTPPVSDFDARKLETLTPPQSPVLMRILLVPSN
ncbi:MAG: helix-turn-helix transcriptional regulator [Victivallales bacterium]